MIFWVPVGGDPEGEVHEGVGGLDGDEEGAAQIVVGAAAEVAGEEFGEPVGDAVVGVGVAGADRDLVAEVDEGEAGRGALHRQVLVEHGVQRLAPAAVARLAQALGDALRVALEVALGQRVGHLALVAEEAVDRPMGTPARWATARVLRAS
ncbi:hypothetical protein SCYAM73S_03341 [Streptomyces cyaneofuscatus]